MKFLFPHFLVMFMLCISLKSDATDNHALKNQMLRNLDSIHITFEAGYGPAEWKSDYFGWNLDEEINRAKKAVDLSDHITVKEFQQIISRFFHSINDHHVKVDFYSTEAAILPFTLKGAEGRYFITWLDPDFFELHSHTNFSYINVGDEVLSVDGKPIQIVIDQIKKEQLGHLSSATNDALAEIFLTHRMSSYGHYVPHGIANVVISSTTASASNDYTQHYQFPWNYQPERIAPYSTPEKQRLPLAKINSPIKFLEQCDNPREIKGGWKSFIPELGNVIWVPTRTCPFYAYIFEGTEHKKIGYIRIPNYAGDQEVSEEFKKLIAIFEEHTDALVIDQVNNTGGAIFYTYRLLSMLTNKPLTALQQRTRITPKDISMAYDSIYKLENVSSDRDAIKAIQADNYFGYPVDKDLAQSFLEHSRFIIDQSSTGKTLTDKHYLSGIEQIQPHATTTYTKPLLILINELDFSCAEIFPALLQDNQRATIFGSPTAGAGGTVVKHTYPNQVGISSYSYTTSIWERANGSVIENMGVTPDIPYSVTAHDLQNNYVGYVYAVNAALRCIIGDHNR